ncbi:hypothetical protein Hanom_Chr13g01235331 [Helianthus anomalus]
MMSISSNNIKKMCKMLFLSMRFSRFCNFRPKVCFSAPGFKRFKISPFSPNSLTPLNEGFFRLFRHSY